MDDKTMELCERIARLMEEHGLKVFDMEFILELLEKTVVRAEKECSH